MIPSDEAQADAGAEWAKRLGVAQARVVGDASPFSRVMESAFGEQARLGDQGRAREAHGPGRHRGLMAENGSPQPDTRLLRRLRDPDGPAAALRDERRRRRSPDGDRRAARTRPGVRALARSAGVRHVRRPGPRAAAGAGQRFLRAFSSATTGRPAATRPTATRRWRWCSTRSGAPATRAPTGLRRQRFFDTADRDSVLGTYSIDDVGDTTLNRLAGYRRQRAAGLRHRL